MNYNNGFEDSNDKKWVYKTLGALAIGGGVFYLWMTSPIKARMDTTEEQVIQISKRFRRELFDYHLEFHNLAKEYILLREAQGRPVNQRPNITTCEISVYLENSSIALEYAEKRLEIIKSIQPYLNINQYIKKSQHIVEEYIKIVESGGTPSPTLIEFHSEFFFESVFLDGQTIAIGHIPITDKPEILDHRACLKLHCDYVFHYIDSLIEFFEKNKNNPSYLDKKNKLKKLNKEINRMTKFKQDLTELVGEEQCEALKEDIRLYGLKTSYEVSDEFLDRYDMGYVYKFFFSFTSICFGMVDSILKKHNSEYYFGVEKSKIKFMKDCYKKFGFEQAEGEIQAETN